MQRYNLKPVPPAKGPAGYPFLSTSEKGGSVNFNTLAVQQLDLNEGNRVEFYEDQGRLYVQKCDNQFGFLLTTKGKGTLSLASAEMARIINHHFSKPDRSRYAINPQTGEVTNEAH